MNRTHILTTATTVIALAAALTIPAAYAQRNPAPQTQRLSGTIERVDGNTVYAKARDGAAITIKLSDKFAVGAVLKATLADIKPGMYVGSGAVPQADGSQKALEVHIFPEPQSDGGHHYADWNGAPNGTMTNGFVQPVGAVGATLASAGDPVLVVKYPEGEKRIIVSANAHIVRNAPGDKNDLKPGAAFRVQEASKQPDGTYTASRINVGRDGARPF